MAIKDAYLHLKEEIKRTALACGRNSEEITLVVVTKTTEWSAIQHVYSLGQRDFGESRLQEALIKQREAPSDCKWHLIGTLQKNKVLKAIQHFPLIHSVDSFELAKKISDCSVQLGITTHILLQANTSSETTKHGATPEQWNRSFVDLLNLPGLVIDGLMTMAPLTEDDRIIHRCFSSLRKLKEELNVFAGGKAHLHQLSMGMTHDYKIAIEEGATLLRIGSAIFNP